jgi:hypothetical protein
MSHLRHTVLAITLATTAVGTWAQTATPGQPSNQQAAPATQRGNVDPMAAMDKQMKTMREMHEKMTNAKTPEDRNALMADHMKTMQDGMSMMMGGTGMGGMQGQKPVPGNMNDRQQMMEKRMDMMQSMMQMMMDRMPAAPAK